MLVLRVHTPTPSLVEVQFIHRTPQGDAVRGYAQPTRAEWDSPSWQHIRAGCAVEAPPSPLSLSPT